MTMETTSTSQAPPESHLSPQTSSQLCVFCQGINLEDLKSGDGYTHQPTGGTLVLSAEACALCRLIVNLFKRHIHERRRATSPIRNISDVLHWGPVSMFAAGRELNSKGTRMRGPVSDRELSLRVAVTMGVANSVLRYGPESPTLLMFTDAGSFPESMGIAGLSAPARGIQDDPICALNISKTLSWADRCEKDHITCNGNSPWLNFGDTVGPVRLLQVGLVGQPVIKLVRTYGRRVKYVALSYCWGEKHSGLLTTDETIGRLMTPGIPLALLSQTIQDAVEVTRRLGIKYLWVDALCIIQEQPDKADWTIESAKMGLIYANAYLTIAATSASSASQGFLTRANRSGVSVNFRVCRAGPCEGKIYFREYTRITTTFYEDVECSPLLKRAWVKQERILSRRTVDFSSRQIYWTCRTSRYAEDGQVDGDGAIEASAVLSSVAVFGLSRGAPEDQMDMMRGMFFSSWIHLIREYTALQLKFESDRLPALAGIAGVLGQSVPGRYLSGIWEASLPGGLLWEPLARPARRSTQACLPSWSWASVVGPISASGPGPEGARAPARLLGASVHETGREILHLQGQLHRCRVRVCPQPPPPPCRSDRKLQDPRVEIPAYEFALDAAVGPRPLGEQFDNTCHFDGPRGTETDFYALGLQNFPNRDSRVGLLLRKLDGAGDEAFYERAGLMWTSDRFWHALQGVSVQLI